jgi:hypothetical protein
MSYLWFEDTSVADRGESIPWAVAPLDGAGFALQEADGEDLPLRRVRNTADVLLMRGGEARESGWVLVSRAQRGVRVNGNVVLGLKQLRDRDEISVPRAGRFFFSTEHLAEVEPFPGSDREIRCARCTTPILKGTPAVRCPKCHLWHHQGERPCWTYAGRCASCDHPTELPSHFQWTPEGL